jgi:hypothetical protein
MNEIAQRWVELGETEKARSLSHENLELIFQIRDESSRAVELANLSVVREKLNFDLSEQERIVVERVLRTA